MLQKNNDKKSKYIFIWFNFIDLDYQSTIIFNINKKTLKKFHYYYLFDPILTFYILLFHQLKLKFYS
ncbi:hypothetical protein CXF59_13315 [Flavobacterium sp. ALD4]|nr:hypothetical protein CXF59_13315 [Flavobacterium sp. ALD4]